MGVEFAPTEGMLRLLAAASMQQSSPEKARTFAEMRVSQYPESAGAHEFLGDLLAGEGSTDEARRHYEHALALDPDDEDLRDKLSELESGTEGTPR